MSRAIKAPEGQVQQGQQSLLQRRPLKHHASRCVCGKLIQWCGAHNVPFDREPYAGETSAEGEEGAVMGVRLLSDPEYPTGWWRLVGGPNPQIIMPPLHPIYILHGCAAWNGAVLFSEVKK